MSYWMIGSEIFTDELLARKWLEQHPMNRGRLLFVEESELSAARDSLASAVATHRAEMAAMVKQVNEALKVRDLAREASNRDLLAKREAEAYMQAAEARTRLAELEVANAVTDREQLQTAKEALACENARLRLAIQNKQGDDLCWIEDAAKARALPKDEFIESCRRYREQIAGKRGELKAGQMTIAQLEARVLELEQGKSDTEAELDRVRAVATEMQSALRELSEAVRHLGTLKGGKTLFELSPTSDDDAHQGWIALNEAQKKAAAVIAEIKASEDRAFGELVALRKVCQDALPLISGWREAIVLLEDFCGESARLKNMVAAADQLDEFRNALVLALAASTSEKC